MVCTLAFAGLCAPALHSTTFFATPLGAPLHYRSARRVRPISSSSSITPGSPPGDYVKRIAQIDRNPLNRMLTRLFAARLAAELGVPPPPATEGYAAVMRLVVALNDRAKGDPADLTEAAVRVLNSLFPAWLPPAFVVMFSRPVPDFAIWINAVVTVAVTQWLMGPSRLVAADASDGGMTVEIERCRYLEESGCVGICMNSCKSATETFFTKAMGLPLYIEPNFEDYSCQFKFGVVPPPQDDQDCSSEPCFPTCNFRAMSTRRSSSACPSLEK